MGSRKHGAPKEGHAASGLAAGRGQGVGGGGGGGGGGEEASEEEDGEVVRLIDAQSNEYVLVRPHEGVEQMELQEDKQLISDIVKVGLSLSGRPI